MTKDWEKRFDEWHAANFIDEGIIGTRKQERKKIKTWIAKQRTQLLKEVRERAVKIFNKYPNEPMTGNVVMLELKVLLEELEEGK